MGAFGSATGAGESPASWWTRAAASASRERDGGAGGSGAAGAAVDLPVGGVVERRHPGADDTVHRLERGLAVDETEGPPPRDRRQPFGAETRAEHDARDLGRVLGLGEGDHGHGIGELETGAQLQCLDGRDDVLVPILREEVVTTEHERPTDEPSQENQDEDHLAEAIALALLAPLDRRGRPGGRGLLRAVDDTIVAIGGAAAGSEWGSRGMPPSTWLLSRSPTGPGAYSESGVKPNAPAANASLPVTTIGAASGAAVSHGWDRGTRTGVPLAAAHRPGPSTSGPRRGCRARSPHGSRGADRGSAG